MFLVFIQLLIFNFTLALIRENIFYDISTSKSILISKFMPVPDNVPFVVIENACFIVEYFCCVGFWDSERLLCGSSIPFLCLLLIMP